MENLEPTRSFPWYLKTDYPDRYFHYGDEGRGIILSHGLVYVSAESAEGIYAVEGPIVIDEHLHLDEAKFKNLDGELPEDVIQEIIVFTEEIGNKTKSRRNLLARETMEGLASILEEQSRIKEFDEEAKRALVKEGYTIYALTGASAEGMSSGFKDLVSLLKDHPQHLRARSRKSEVAVKHDSYYLAGSGDKSFLEQQAMVENFSLELQTKIPNVEAVVGIAADYIELSIRHANETRKPFKNEIGTFTRTLSMGAIGPDSVIVVGRGGGKGEIFLMSAPNQKGVSNLQIAPIVVPV